MTTIKRIFALLVFLNAMVLTKGCNIEPPPATLTPTVTVTVTVTSTPDPYPVGTNTPEPYE